MLVNIPRPARMDMGCQSSALTKAPAVLQSNAARMRKRIALRRSVRGVIVNPLGFVVKACGLYRNNSECSFGKGNQLKTVYVVLSVFQATIGLSEINFVTLIIGLLTT